MHGRRGARGLPLARALAALALGAVAVLGSPVPPAARINATASTRAPLKGRRQWGPPDLQEICDEAAGVCHRFGFLSAPLQHADPSQGTHELAYFVNADFWDPVARPNAPIFVNTWYGATAPGAFANGLLRAVGEATFSRQFPGASAELARELGALIISVPNR